MAEAASSKPDKKGTNPLVFVGVGFLVIVILLSLASAFVGRFFAKRIGTGLISGLIEKKTGVKTNIQDLEKGKMTFTDEKTGAKIEVGTGKIPDNFPKDFPIYPGAEVTGSLSGAQAGSKDGFWLTLSSKDAFDKVNGFYTTALKANGWTAESSTIYIKDTTAETVTKGTWTGTLTVTADSTKGTQIVIVLGKGEATPSPEPGTTTETNGQ